MAWVIAAIPLAIWGYLVFMVWKRKASMFHDQMEPESAERRLRILKRFLLVAGIALVVGAIVSVGYAIFGDTEAEGGALFVILLSLVGVFVIGTAGGLVTFLRERR